MSVEIKVPELGESIVEATVGHWLKRAGEHVEAGEPVVELETEKVNMEVVTPTSGVLRSVSHEEGATVNIGETLAIVDDAPAGGPGGATSASASADAPSPTLSPIAPASNGASAASNGHAALMTAPTEGADVTPVARRIAAEHSIDLRQIQGTGMGGRITQDDVQAYIKSAAAPTSATTTLATPAVAPIIAPAVPPAIPSTPPVAPPVLKPEQRMAQPPTSAPAPITTGVARPEERIRLSRRRQTIARRLIEAQHTAAMLTTFNEIDMSAVIELRQRRRDAFKQRYGVSLGFMSFFSRAVIGALKAYPRINAEIQGEELVLKRYYDLGIAVSADEGLVVPVLRDADRLSFGEIEQRIAALADKARKNMLALDDLIGGTFTITNGGIFGSMLSTPILNGPQVGILGMHKIEERPIALNGQVVIHPMMYVALTYDHRIVDGSEAVGFLVRVKQLIEDPESLLLEA